MAEYTILPMNATQVELVHPMLREAITDTGYDVDKYDQDHVQEHFEWELRRGMTIALLVFPADDLTTPVGFLRAPVTKVFFYNEKAVSGAMFYIMKEHRGGGVARKLLQRFDAECDAWGVSYVDVNITGGEALEETLALLDASGYKKLYGNYRKTY